MIIILHSHPDVCVISSDSVWFVCFASSFCPDSRPQPLPVYSSSSPVHVSSSSPLLYLLWVLGVGVKQADFRGASSPHVFCVSLLQLLPHLALPLHSHQEAAPPCPRRGLRPHLLDTNAPCLTHPARSLTVHTVKGAWLGVRRHHS